MSVQRYRPFQWLLVWVMMFCWPAAGWAGKVMVYSAVYPPYQIDERGKLTGINTEIVRAVFYDSGIPFEIKYVPWSRAQKIVGDEGRPSSAIYCLAKTKERESKYQWVGAYYHQTVSFLTLKGSGVEINSLEDAKQYVIGLVRGDKMTAQLLSKGCLGSYEFVGDDILNVRKLFKRRIQAIVTCALAAKYIAKEIGLDPHRIVKQYDVSTDQFNLAVSLRTPEVVYLKLVSSLNKLLENGKIQSIINHWR